MLRRFFIGYSISIFGTLLLKPTNLSASINSIRIGEKAHNFLLKGINKNNSRQREWSLDDYSGKWLIVYFYPKDFSSGCTLQAKGFQDKLSKYKRLNCSIVGITLIMKKIMSHFVHPLILDIPYYQTQTEKLVNYTIHG